MLAPCGSRMYFSCRSAYAWNDTAVTSYVPSNAARFSVSMSCRTWPTSSPPVSTWPLARPKNMKASSESGLWATVMRIRRVYYADAGPGDRRQGLGTDPPGSLGGETTTDSLSLRWRSRSASIFFRRATSCAMRV